ncbi:MAG: shikimate kinase [Balneola sp.]|nr:MAG: shikimate kinase [Balneola sp.]
MNDYRLNRFQGSIFLTGFMASGKSTIGRLVAELINRPFVDLDEIIEEKERKSIKDIFKEEGEKYFRDKEREYLLELTKNFSGVIALGGGALQNQRIIDQLKLRGLLVLIKIPLEVIIERVSRNKNRPITLDAEGKIKSRETLLNELKSLYLSREGLYSQAQITVESDGYRPKEEIAQILIEKLKRHV